MQYSMQFCAVCYDLIPIEHRVAEASHFARHQTMTIIVGFSHSYFRKSEHFNTFWLMHHTVPIFYLLCKNRPQLSSYAEANLVSVCFKMYHVVGDGGL